MALAVMVLVASSACSGDDGEVGERDAGSEPTTTVAPLERPALEDLEAAGVRVERIEPELAEGERFETHRLSRRFVVVDDTLLALAVGAPGATSLPGGPAVPGGRLVERSTDLGETWEPVALPGAPDGPQVVPPVLMDAGDRAVVVGSLDDVHYAGSSSIWTSDDGETWTNGQLGEVASNLTLVLPIVELADGRLAVGLYPYGDPDPGDTTTGEPPPVLVSDDSGATWQPGPCPPEWTWSEAGCSLPSAFDGLWFDGSKVSLDQGTTWQLLVVDPAIDDTTSIYHATALPSGGWLGVGGHIEGPGVNRYTYLLRSDDGIRWNVALDDRCDDQGPTENINSTFSSPVALGDRWIVTHNCEGVRSELYLLDPDGTNPQEVLTSDVRDLVLGPPLTIGDTVIVPELDHTNPSTLLHLTPSDQPQRQPA